MITCPVCDSPAARVLQTFNDEPQARGRKRFCLSCGSSYLTMERVERLMERGKVAKPKPAAKPAAKLAAAPPPKPPAKLWPVAADGGGEVFAGLSPDLQETLLDWWNVSRRQRHPGAAWTELAWRGSVNRVADMLHQLGPDAALELAKAAAEAGWQAIKAEYLKQAPASPAPPAAAREGSAVSAIQSMLRRANA